MERVDRINEAARREQLTPPDTIQRTKAVRYPVGTIRRAQIQNIDDAASGKFSAKLLGAGGTQYGNAFDVYAFPDGAATDYSSNYRPLLAADQKVIIFKDVDSNWYLDRPNLQSITKITVISDVHAGASQLEEKHRTNVEVMATDSESSYTKIDVFTSC